MHCDYTVHVSADLSLWLDSPGHPDAKACPPSPSRLFLVPPGREVGMDKCKLGVISQERFEDRG